MKKIILFLFFGFIGLSVVFADVIYVNVATTASTPDGKTWATAYPKIDDAIFNSKAGDSVWVAQGTYDMIDTDYKRQIKRSISIFGGFDGNESEFESRDVKVNKTLITMSKSAPILFDIQVSNIKLVVDGFSVTNTLNYFVNSSLENNITFNNLDIYKCNSAPIVNCYSESTSILISNTNYTNSSAQFLNTSKGIVQIINFNVEKCTGQLINTNSSINITNSKVIDNNCSSSGNFININSSDKSFDISNTIFENNTAASTLLYSSCKVTNIAKVTFKNTSANSILYSPSSETNIINSTFSNNTTTSPAINIGSTIANLKNVEVVGNKGNSQIFNFSGSKLTVTSSKFTSNSAANMGGAFYASCNELYINDVQFTSNTTSQYAPFYFSGSNFNMNNCQFLKNSSTSTDIGLGSPGAMYISANVDLSITNSAFRENSSIQSAGVAYLNCYGTFTANNNIFAYNKSIQGNGGVFYNTTLADLASSKSPFHFYNSIFEGNEAIEAGVVFRSASCDFTNCVFKNNKANTDAIMKQSGFSSRILNCIFNGNECTKGTAAVADMSMNIRNSVFVNNKSADYLFWGPYQNFTFNNNIVWNNQVKYPFVYYAGSFPVPTTTSHSNIQGGIQPGEGNMSVDPMFVNEAAGDFRLSCESPLINKGTNENTGENDTDIDGNSRKFGAFVDMGAYEFQQDAAVASQNPIAGFTPSSSSSCITENITFTNTTAPISGNSYLWNFGDGSTSTEINPSHQFSISGTYNVKLTASTVCGKISSIEKTITVKPSFVAEILGAETVCPTTTSIYSTTAACSTFTWTVTGGTIVSGQGTSTISVNWGDGLNGNGKVVLQPTACGVGFCDLPVSKVVPIVPVNFEIQGKSLACNGSVEKYSTKNQDAALETFYKWSVDNGGIIQGNASGYDLKNILISWNATGPTTAKVYLETWHELLKCGRKDSFIVNVKPQLKITKPSDSKICASSSQSMSLINSGSVTWSALGSDSTKNNIIYWGAKGGFYNIIATKATETDFCNNADTLQMQVIEIPKISNITGENEVTLGSIYTYSADFTNSVIKPTYQWTIKNGSIVSQNDNSVSIKWTGVDTLKLVVTDAPNCISKVQGLAIVKDFDMKISGDDAPCISTPITYTATTDALNTLQYRWLLNGVDLNINNFKVDVEFQNPSIDTLVCEVTRKGKKYTTTKFIDSKALPSDISLTVSPLIGPNGGGTYSYNISNPSAMTYNYNVIGSVGNSISGNKLNVTWGTVGPFEITITPTKVGADCPAKPIVYNVAKAQPLTNYLGLVSGKSCLNSIATYFVSIDNQSNVKWSLPSGGGVILNSTNSEVTIQWGDKSSGTGRFPISWTCVRFGETVTTIGGVYIGDNPTPSISGSSRICGESNTELYVSNLYKSYQWILESDKSIVSTSNIASVNKEGLYHLIVTDQFNCSGSDQISINKIPLPETKIMAVSNTNFCKGSSADSVKLVTSEAKLFKYEWFKNGVSIGNNSPKLYFVQSFGSVISDSYKVKTSLEGCESASSEISVDVYLCGPGGGNTGGGFVCQEPDLFINAQNNCQPFQFQNATQVSDNLNWNFGDSEVSSSSSPIHTYKREGIYTVNLSRKCAVASPIKVEVSAVAEFEKVTEGCIGLPILFKDYSRALPITPITDWKWDFGDGTPTVLESGVGRVRDANHEYSKPGEYFVSLTVYTTNSNGIICADTKQISITVRSSPKADFSVINPPCSDDLYQFINKSTFSTSSIVSSWDLSDGNLSTATNGSIRYVTAAPVSKTVKLTVNDVYGCSSSVTKTFTVNPKVTPKQLTKSAGLELCNNTSLVLTSPLSSGTYTWYKNGIIETNANSKNYTVISEGKYFAKYTESNCAVNTDTLSVNKFSVPNTISGKSNICMGENATLSIGTIDLNKYDLTWLNGATVLNNKTAGLTILKPTTSATYSVIVKDKNSSCQFTIPSFTVNFNNLPTQPVFSTDVSSICNGDNVTASVTNIENGVNYEWYLNGVATGLKSTSQLIKAISNNPKAELSVLATNSAGCITKSEIGEITVAAPINTNFSVSKLSVCEGTSITLQSSLNTNDYTFEWYKSDTLITGYNSNQLVINDFKLLNVGKYYIKVISKGTVLKTGCIANSPVLDIKLKSAPTQPTLTGATEFCDGETSYLTVSNSTNLRWNTGETKQTIAITKSGVYTATITDPVTLCEVNVSQTVTKNPLPNTSFIDNGNYEKCNNEAITFEGLNNLKSYQWYLNGTQFGKANQALIPTRNGAYSVELISTKNCKATSKAFNITTKECNDSCIVTNTNDLGTGSLREAIICANTKPGKDVIKFKIPGNGLQVINVKTALPKIVESVIVDGFSQAGNDNYAIQIAADSYKESAFEFDYDVDDVEIEGVEFNGFKKALVLNSLCDNFSIVKNHFIGNTNTSIQVANVSEYHLIQANQFTGTGINILSSNNRIVENEFTNTDYGVKISGTVLNNFINKNSFTNIVNEAIAINGGATLNTISNNYFTNIKSNAVYLDKAGIDNNITSNYIGFDKTKTYGYINKNGIVVANSAKTIIAKNVIVGVDSSAIKTIKSGLVNITNNYLGTDASNVVKGNKYYGINALSKIYASNNIIANNKQSAIYSADSSFILKNIFKDNILGGVSTFGKYIHISQNIFNNTGKAIDLRLTSNNPSNDSKSAPNLIGGFYVGTDYVLKGTSTIGDSIEVFVSNIDGSNAISYIARGLVTRSDNVFEISIPDSIKSKGSIYVVATATNNLTNTSELSQPVKICATCACEVTNTNASGEGSLFEAINCANAKPVKTTITFAIPGAGPYIINQNIALPTLSNTYGISIDGLSQQNSGKGTGSQKIIVRNADLSLTKGDNTVANISLQKGDVIVKSSNTILNSLNLNDAKKGISIEKNANTLVDNTQILNCKVDTATNGVIAEGTNTVINKCDFNHVSIGVSTQVLNQNLIVKNTKIVNANYGVYTIADAGGFTLDSLDISFITKDGIHIENSSNVSVSNSKIVSSSVDNGVSILNVEKPVLTNLEIDGYKNGLVLENTNKATLTKSTITGADLGTGLQLSGNECRVENNKIVRFNKNALIGGGENNQLKYNTLGLSTIAVEDLSIGSEFSSNYLGFDSLGNDLPIGESAIIVGGRKGQFVHNYVGNVFIGFELKYASDSILIDNNIVGTAKNGAAKPVLKSAFEALQSSSYYGFTKSTIVNNKISNTDQVGNFEAFSEFNNNPNALLKIENNVIGTNVNGGFKFKYFGEVKIANNFFDTLSQNAIELENCTNIKMTKNTILSPKTLFINIHHGDNTVSNNGKSSPIILASKVNTSDWNLVGKATPNDTVEIFKGATNEQTASKYIGYAVAGYDSVWTAVLQLSDLNQTQKSYFVATATDQLNNSSELSKPYGFCESCVCWVKNTKDANTESFREAINNANKGDCGNIKFDIPLMAEYKIVLETELPSVSRPVKIDATTQVGYNPLKTPVIQLLPQNSNDFDGLTLSNSFISVAGIYFNGFATGVVVNGNNNTLTNSTIGNSKDANVIVNGKYNAVTNSNIGKSKEGVEIGGQSDGILVNGSYNTIESNIIANNANNGIVVSKGFHNDLLKNIIYDNGVGNDNAIKAIQLVNNGNNNKSVPTFTNYEVKTTEVIIRGRATNGDKIQLFTNNNLPEEAIAYVGETYADINGDWFIAVPNSFLSQSQNSYFVATATSSAIGTSPLSAVFQVGNYAVSCYVTNVKNTGKGSLRAAVGCVNAAGTGQGLSAQIIFQLPSISENNIPVEVDGFDITNKYGVYIDPKQVPVTLTAQSGADYAFNWKVQNVTINNLKFKSFDIAIKTQGDSSIIKSNIFIDNAIAISVSDDVKTQIQSNTINGGKVAIWAKKSTGKINNNIIGNVTKPQGAGIVVENSSKIELINNQIIGVQQGTIAGLNSSFENKPAVISASSNINFKQNTITASSLNSGIYVVNVKSSSFEINTINSGDKGIEIVNSKNLVVSKNTTNSQKLAGIYLSKDSNITITQNLTTGLQGAAKPIEIQYGSVDESNNGKKMPELKYATYKRKTLYIHGEAEHDDKVEVFLTDGSGLDLKQHFQTVTTDQYGKFVFSFPVNPSDINTYNFRATSTISSYGLKSDNVYTSEASDKFNPNLKICVVTNNLNSGKGSLRANIDTANADRCNLMLFELPVGQLNISPSTDLPIITAPLLTIDATSQDGYSNKPIVTLNDVNSFENALSVNTNGIFNVHGLAIKGYNNPLKISQVKEFEQSLGELTDFKTGVVELISSKHKMIELDSNVYSSTTTKYAVSINKPKILLRNNTINAGKDTSITITADSVLVLNNTLSFGSFLKNSTAISVSNTDSVTIRGNKISKYGNGLFAQSAKNLIIATNTLDSTLKQSGYSKAVLVKYSDGVKVLGNKISRSDSSIIIDSSANMLVSGNTLDSCRTSGIRVYKSDNSVLSSNTIFRSIYGINLVNSKEVEITKNTLYRHQLAGVYIDSLSEFTNIKQNTIGSSFKTATSKSKGAGLIIKSNNNQIGGDTSKANYILNNTMGGVLVYGNFNKITGNSIFDNDTTLAAPIHYAIQHLVTGNELKLKPSLDSFKTIVRNKEFIVYGSAEPNDSIHIYRADGVYENAKYYVNKVLADANGKWSLSVDIAALKPELKFNTLTLVATATNDKNNTSQLSNMLYIGACYVANINDENDNTYPAPNSMRQAVKCANSQAEYVDVKFAIEENSIIPIFLKGEMLHLTNTYGVNFDAKNLLAEKQNTQVSYGAVKVENKFNTFWKIDSLVGPSKFKNMEVSAFDTAMVFNTKKDIAIDSMKFSNIEKNAIVLGKNIENYTLNKLRFTQSPKAIYISSKSKTANLLIQNSTFKQGDIAILLDIANQLSMSNDSLALCNTLVSLANSNNVKLINNKINTETNSYNIKLNNVSGLVDGNAFYGNTPLNSIDISNSQILTISNNTQSDTCDVFVNIVNSDSVLVDKNKIAHVQNFVKTVVSKRVKVLNNTINYSNKSAFDIISSKKIALHENLVLDTKNSNVYPIDIYRSNPLFYSNKKKADPIILGYNLKKAEEGDCISEESRLGIFLYGKAAPLDNVEIFFTDSVKNTLKEYVISGKADENGDWDIRIPRSNYLKDPRLWYHFVATATDTASNTSQISNKLNFGKVVNKVVVKYSNNAGSFTLRDAIEKINCSDVRSKIVFEMDSLKSHVITLTDSLPKVNAFMGFEMDGSTQKHYADSLKLDFAVQKIVITTAKDISNRPVFTILSKTDSSIVKSLWFENCKKGIRVENKMNVFDSLHFQYSKQVDKQGDTAIYVKDGSENVFKNSYINGYHLGVYLPKNTSKNKFINDTITSTVAYLFEENTIQNLIDRNIINTDSISVIFKKATELNIVKNSQIGSVANPITYPAFYLLHSSNQNLINNTIPVADITLSKVDKAFVVIKGKSNSNTIASCKFGVDKKHDFHVKSNVRGVWIKPGKLDSIPSNTTIASNEFVGLTLPAIQIDSAEIANINDNYIGIDSLFKSKGEMTTDYSQVPGVDAEGILVTKSNFVSVNNNTILNYGTYGIDAKSSTNLIVEKNKIFSEKSNKKAVNLNNGDVALASNLNAIAPYDTISPPLIKSDNIEGTSKLTLSGTSKYPNATVFIFESFENGQPQPKSELNQALRYVKNTQTNADGTWSIDVSTANFGFTKYNRYVAQLTYLNQSSELSTGYKLEPLLCKLVGKVDLLETEYNPCPKSNFKVDATLGGLIYSWSSDKFETISTQVAQIDTSADNIKLSIKDGISDCELVEYFNVKYKPRPVYPEFIVSSGIYVGDTISLVDVSVDRPELFDWSSSASVLIVPSKSNENIVGPDGKTYPSEREVRFIVPDTGIYTITERSLRNGCFISVDKTIQAQYKDPNEKEPYALAPSIESLVVAPVPVPAGQNSNAFLKVKTKDPIYLSVLNLEGVEVFSTVISGSLSYNIPLSLAKLTSGVYVVKLETELETLTYKIVVGK